MGLFIGKYYNKRQEQAGLLLLVEQKESFNIIKIYVKATLGIASAPVFVDNRVVALWL